METKCSKKGCVPHETGCISGKRKFHTCQYWKAENEGEEKGDSTTKKTTLKQEGILLPWTSNSLGLESLSLPTSALNVNIIGLIGAANSGKTSFLSMLFQMLLAGEQLNGWRFSHSYTLQGWRNIAAQIEWAPGNLYTFPSHTSKNAGRIQALLHLALKKGDKIRDFVFTDVSGEWFTEWAKAQDSKTGEGAKWIHQHADAFLFFMDCEKLIAKATIGEGRREIFSIGDRLKNGLAHRPVAALWAKADLKADVRPRIVERLTDEVKHRFGHHTPFYDVSVYRISEEDDSHQKNIFETLLWLENRLERKSRQPIAIHLPVEGNDFFFHFKAQ